MYIYTNDLVAYCISGEYSNTSVRIVLNPDPNPKHMIRARLTLVYYYISLNYFPKLHVG